MDIKNIKRGDLVTIMLTAAATYDVNTGDNYVHLSVPGISQTAFLPEHVTSVQPMLKTRDLATVNGGYVGPYTVILHDPDTGCYVMRLPAPHTGLTIMKEAAVQRYAPDIDLDAETFTPAEVALLSSRWAVDGEGAQEAGDALALHRFTLHGKALTGDMGDVGQTAALDRLAVIANDPSAPKGRQALTILEEYGLHIAIDPNGQPYARRALPDIQEPAPAPEPVETSGPVADPLDYQF